jgi:D-alanyl-D-alanine carboxypeptidase
MVMSESLQPRTQKTPPNSVVLPVAVRAPIVASTKIELNQCLKWIQTKMMEWQNESAWNDKDMIALRTKIYEWEKAIYKEPDWTMPHRKFMRNYLLQLESGFDETAWSRTGAKWMMQITGTVLDDMAKRSFFFREQIRLIRISPEVHNLFPKHIRTVFEDIIKNPDTPVNIDGLIKYFRTGQWRQLLQTNGYVNAYIGSMYLWILNKNVNIETIPEEMQYYRKLTWNLNYKNINTLIRDKLLSIEPNPGKVVKIPEFTQETYKVFLDTLNRNPELARSLFSARRYNWSDTKKWYERYGVGLREKDVYFITLGYATTMAMLSDSRYHDVYCGDKTQWAIKKETTPTSSVSTWTPTSPSVLPSQVVVKDKPSINLDVIKWVVWTIMVSEIKKSTDGKRTSIVIGKNFEDSRLGEAEWIASLTKVMTALVAYEICTQKWWDPSKKTITILPEYKAWDTPWRTKRPSIWTIEDAVNAMMMKSDNTIANALANELVQYDEFIRRMNISAKRIGMTSSQFYTPSGLTENKKFNISTEIDIQKLVTHIIGTPYNILGPTQDTEQLYPANQIKWGKLRSADRVFLEILEKSYPGWEMIWTKTGYSKDAWKCVITVIKHKKTWRIFSIVGFNMANGDGWRRRIRFKIIDQLDELVS